MGQDNAVHILNINGTLTLFDTHGVSLGAVGGGGLTEPLDLTEVLTLASLTTVERDALIPVEGMVIYNTTTDQVEAYQDGAWGALGGSGGGDVFADGSVPFTGSVGMEQDLAVNRDAVIQRNFAVQGHTTFQGPVDGSLELTGSRKSSGLPTSDPHVAGEEWVNAGIVMRSAG